MPAPSTPAPPSLLGTPIRQIALIVPDLEPAVRAYAEALGIGPWNVYTIGAPTMTGMTYRGRPVHPASIKRMGLMTVEGEKDDICSIGQTLAAQDLCTGVRAYRKVHHMQAGVGHYGVFSGKRWNNEIYPLLRDFVHVNS
jgi:hypothetical protein